jgi:hypothetical protein
MALVNHNNATITYIASLIDAEKLRGQLIRANQNNQWDHTFVVFDYISSKSAEGIQSEQMTPDGISLHAALNDAEVKVALQALYCPNQNCVLHTRRKIDYSVPGGKRTDKRQLVMKVYSDPYDDMPSLIQMNTTTPFVW